MTHPPRGATQARDWRVVWTWHAFSQLSGLWAEPRGPWARRLSLAACALVAGATTQAPTWRGPGRPFQPRPTGWVPTPARFLHCFDGITPHTRTYYLGRPPVDSFISKPSRCSGPR